MSDTKILIAEDEEGLRIVLSEYLQQAGYDVTLACDGVEAWNILALRGDEFATVILDRMMPNLDGLALLKRIKADDRLRFLPVIVQTALDGRDEILEGINAGAFYYLVKPFDPVLLLSIVATAVEDQARYRALLQQVHVGLSTLGLLRKAEYAFRTLAECRALAACLSNATPNPGKVSMGLLELFVNAIEHGNLGIGYDEKGRLQAASQWEQEIDKRLQDPRYRDREVLVNVEQHENILQIDVRDQGTGFDWKNYLQVEPERIYHTHGRGIALAKSISFDSLEYQGCGNQVRVTVKLDAGKR
jgi:sigma-B regulation protein RsbU (phosphoserine phosphatase)